MAQDMKQLDKANVRLRKQSYQTKLLDMDKQLASSIQTQVVETSRALELLKLSHDDIVGIDSNFKRINDKCMQCKKYLSQFAQIKKLSLARNNLRITTKIGKLFREVPNKAQHLLNLLNDNPDKYLFYVYKNLRKLVRLRDETLNKGLKYMTQLTVADDGMRDHFKLIDAVILNLEKQCRMNICDALYLAVKQPQTLVETLKICESEDRTVLDKNKILSYSMNDWGEWRERESKEEDIELIDYPIRTVVSDSMHDKVKSEILSSIVSLTEQLQSQSDGKIKEFVSAMDENMKDLEYVNEYLRVTFPPHYAIVSYYVETYFKFLQPLILAQLDARNVPTQERLFVVSWINKFKMKIENLQKAMAKYGKMWDQQWSDMNCNLSDQEEALLSSYIHTCRDKLRSWITNIVENESKKREYFMVDNIPRTHCPQDLFTALNHQFTIATQQLKNKPFVSVILMILDSMDKFKTLLTQHIDNDWQKFDDEYFCAMLNSTYDVSSKLKLKCDAILDEPQLYNIDDEDILKLDDAFDDRICHFTNLGKHCAMKLSQKVYNDTLRDNIFTIMFTSPYFDSKPEENEYIQSMILTLSEYFEDFKAWIEEPYFFWELVKELITIITNAYLNSLLTNKPSLDSEDLAYYIRNDVKILDQYFGNNQEFGQIKKLWKEKFKVLNAIHAVLDCEPGFVDAYSKPIQHNHEYGEELIKYIHKLRKKKDKKDKMQMKTTENDGDDNEQKGGSVKINKQFDKLKDSIKRFTRD
eukprot:469813_1